MDEDLPRDDEAPGSAWSDPLNAELYHQFVRRRRLYPALNEALAAWGEMHRARRVLDLACGTGATALACLPLLPPEGELVGADASRAMVEVARTHVRDPRASFLRASLSEIRRRTGGGFDRVLCNAAFWQFPSPRRVLQAAAENLNPGGWFLFNIPAEQMQGASPPPHPYQVALAGALRRRGRMAPAAPAMLDAGALGSLAAEHGFESLEAREFRYTAPQREFLELMSLPAMATRMAPDLDEDERAAVLHEAAAAVDPDVEVTSVWMLFRARRPRAR